jgi:LCP family protein required for cell wall assembly
VKRLKKNRHKPGGQIKCVLLVKETAKGRLGARVSKTKLLLLVGLVAIDLAVLGARAFYRHYEVIVDPYKAFAGRQEKEIIGSEFTVAEASGPKISALGASQETTAGKLYDRKTKTSRLIDRKLLKYPTRKESESGSATTRQSGVTRRDRDKVCIGVLGIERGYGREKGSNTDLLMVVQVDLRTGKTSLINVHRDKEVSIEGKSYKINQIYGLYGGGARGARYLMAVLGDLLYKDISYYYVLDMSGFVSLVDAIGGVSVYVDKDMSYNGVTLKEGYQKLSGEEALVFVRYRDVYGNKERMVRQGRFLSALLSSTKRTLSNPLGLAKVCYIAVRNGSTNLSSEQIAALALCMKKSGFQISGVNYVY